MKTSTPLFVAACLSLPGFASAESNDSISAGDDHSNPISFQRTTPEVADILLKAQAPDQSNLPAPAFVVKSENNNFIMTIGGEINPILGFDIGNNLYKQSGPDFTTSAIPVPALPGHKGDFFINPLTGNLYLQITGLSGTDNQITGYVKIGTNGSNHAINLKRAYVRWRNLTAGLKTTLMEDADACQPPTIDAEGPSGEVSGGAYEVSYMSPSYNGFRWAVGLDMPTFYSSDGVYRGHDFPALKNTHVDTDADQLIPDIPVWAEYTFSDNNRVRVSGLLRNFTYRDLLTQKTRHTSGWGVMLSGNLSPIEPLIFYYQGIYGKGIGNYIQDISGLPISFVPSDANPGHMSPTPMMGWVLGATYNFNSKWQANAMFSQTRVWDCGDYCSANDMSQNYKYALYGAVNCFYNITSYLQAGVECVWGHRQTWDHIGADDTRIQTQLSFTF